MNQQEAPIISFTIYRRHSKKCRGRRKGRIALGCHCPIYGDGYMDGKRILRKSLQTRDAAKANMRMARLVQVCTEALNQRSDDSTVVPTDNAALPAPEPVSPPRTAQEETTSDSDDTPTMLNAVKAYLGNCETNGVKSPTIRKYRNSLTRLAAFMESNGTVMVSLDPVGGFKGTVQFSCSGLPANSKCTFSPASLTADGSNTAQSDQMTIATQGPNSGTVAMMTHPGKPDGIMLAGIFWLPGLLFGGFLFWQRKKLTQKYRILLILLVAAATISGAVGCGSSPIHTAPDSSLVTVTATSGTTSHTAIFDLQVTK